MTESGSAKPGLGRRLVGSPRMGVGVVWCCLGLAWILLGALGGPTTTLRFLLGVVWLALGIPQVVVAVLDRKNQRGFYQLPAPTRFSGPFSEEEQNVHPMPPPPQT